MRPRLKRNPARTLRSVRSSERSAASRVRGLQSAREQGQWYKSMRRQQRRGVAVPPWLLDALSTLWERLTRRARYTLRESCAQRSRPRSGRPTAEQTPDKRGNVEPRSPAPRLSRSLGRRALRNDLRNGL